MYDNVQNIILPNDPNRDARLRSNTNLNFQNTQVNPVDENKLKGYKVIDRGVTQRLKDNIGFGRGEDGPLAEEEENPDIKEFRKMYDKKALPESSSGRVNLKDFKDPFKEEVKELDEDTKEEQKKSFKSLVEEDVNSEGSQLKKIVDDHEEKKRISKMTGKPLPENRETQDQKLRRTAELLGKLWQLTPAQKNHWYRRLKREEKQVAKRLIKFRKRLEERRRIKKLEKAWKIDNDENTDANYFDNKSKEESEVVIPKHFKSLKEYAFFGDDFDYMRHYKRTNRNIHNQLDSLINTGKQSVQGRIRHNTFVQLSHVMLNKAMTVVHVWWHAPQLQFKGASNIQLNPDANDKDEAKRIEDTEKMIELRLNQAIPYLRSRLTQEVGLKYAPEIRFYKDTRTTDIQDFQQSLYKFANPSQESFLETMGKDSIRPLSFEQKMKTDEMFDKQVEEILKSVENEEEKKALRELVEEMKKKDPEELKENFQKMAKSMGITDDPRFKELLQKRENAQKKKPENGKEKKLLKARNPLDLNIFSPMDKTATRMVKSRDKLLNSMGMHVSQFKDQSNKLKEINVNQEVINYVGNYNYEIPTKENTERRKNLSKGIREMSEFRDAPRMSDKKLSDKLYKESPAPKKAERVHFKKKKSKMEAFWDNLEEYYDK